MSAPTSTAAPPPHRPPLPPLVAHPHRRPAAPPLTLAAIYLRRRFSYDCGSEQGAEYTSAVGSGVCDRCKARYYMDDDGVCVEKPSGVEKGQLGTELRTMVVKKVPRVGLGGVR